MFQKHAEHVGVAPRELLLHLVGQAIRVGIGDRGIGAARRVRQQVDVELGVHHLQSGGVQLHERLVDLVDGRRVEAPVRLVADAVDAQLARLEILHELDHAGALRRLLEIEVVVIQLGVRIGLVRELEGLGDVVVADADLPRRLAHRPVFVDRFVDDVPAVDLAFVAPDHGADVIAHAREQRVAIGGLAVGALKHPGARLRMPDEIVPDHLHVAIDAELDVSIRRVERVAIGRRLRRLELQHVLGADLVELLRDEVDGGGVGALELPLVDGDADHHPLRHQVLQRHILVCRRGEKGETGGRDKPSHHADRSLRCG